MSHVGILFKLRKEEGDHGDDDHGRRDDADGGKDAAPEAFELAADEGGHVHRDHPRRHLAQGVVVHQFFFRAPVLVVHDFPLEDRKHGVAAAKSDGPHFGEDEEKFE